jgi:hypothetical protein
MINPNGRYIAAGPATAASGDVPPAGPSSTVPGLPGHARVGVDELRRHWQRDVDQWQRDIDRWHRDVAGLRLRMRVAVGITVAAVLAGGAAIWFAGVHRASVPACPPAHAGRQHAAGGAG